MARSRSSTSKGSKRSSPRNRSQSKAESSTSMDPLETPSDESAQTPPSTELEFVPFRPPAAVRDPNTGRFLPGVSGNPSGAPKGSQHRLTQIKRDLEIAVRENISPYQIAQIVHRMYELALCGSVGAAKLILDKTISNARTEEEEAKAGGGITIRIENLTVPGKEPEREVIDITPTINEEQT